MTVNLFITLLTIFAAAASLITESVKKEMQNHKLEYSANKIALIFSSVVTVMFMPLIYLYLDIAFTIANIAFIPLMVISVWLGSMVGYDKVVQLIEQIGAINDKN